MAMDGKANRGYVWPWWLRLPSFLSFLAFSGLGGFHKAPSGLRHSLGDRQAGPALNALGALNRGNVTRLLAGTEEFREAGGSGGILLLPVVPFSPFFGRVPRFPY